MKLPSNDRSASGAGLHAFMGRTVKGGRSTDHARRELNGIRGIGMVRMTREMIE